MENGHSGREAFILQIGVENRQAFGKEQPLVDNRPRRQRTDVEALNLCLDDLLLDAAADEVERLFKFIEIGRLRIRPCDHDLFDFGPGFLRLAPDDADVDGHLPPAIDRKPCIDDFGFDDGAAGFLSPQVGAGQEDHTDTEPAVVDRLVSARDDGIGKEGHGEVNMQPRAVAGHAVRVDRAAVPHCFQGVDGRSDDAAARTAIGGGDKTDTAGIRFKFGAIHAVAGNARAFGFGGHGLPFGGSALISAIIASTSAGIRAMDLAIRSLCQFATSGSLAMVAA